MGYLFHNCGFDSDPVTNIRLASITSVLKDFDCPMKLNMTGNVFAEHGDTGAACPVLMLAEAAMCAAIAQMPVMVSESRKADWMCVRPVEFYEVIIVVPRDRNRKVTIIGPEQRGQIRTGVITEQLETG